MNNTSNKILAGFILLFILIGFAFIIFVKVKGKTEFQRNTEINIKEDMVSVMFTTNTTEEELEDMEQLLKSEKNIDLYYNKSQFDKKGFLKRLKVDIEFPDGQQANLNAQGFDLGFGYGFIWRPSDTSGNKLIIGADFVINNKSIEVD